MKAIHQILNQEQEVCTVSAVRLRSAYEFREQYLIDQDGDLFLIVDSLILLNYIVTRSRNTHLRTCEVMPAGFNR